MPQAFRHILLAAITLILSSGLHAQRFNGGGFAGINTSQISGDELGGFDKAGLYFGAFANVFSETKPYGWQLEVAYIEKGSRKLAKPDQGDFTSYKLNLNYVESYLLFRYAWSRRLNFETGPSFGVLVRSREVLNDGNAASRLDDGETFNRTDLSLNLGVYYRLTPSWSINVRFADSIIPVRQHASGATYLLNYGQYNEILSFSLHYQINALE